MVQKYILKSYFTLYKHTLRWYIGITNNLLLPDSVLLYMGTEKYNNDGLEASTSELLNQAL